jgi:hypothetical protein
MAKAKVYKIHITIDDSTLNIQAHKFAIEGSEFVTGDKTGRKFSRKLDKRNRDVIAYVLDSEEWDTIRTYWDGYYAWEDSTFLQVGDTPEEIQKWLDSLPEYSVSIGGN